LLIVPDVEYLGFRHYDLMTFANDPRMAAKSLSKSRSQEIDFELDGQDLHVLRNGGECRIPGGMIRHGRHNSGMDEPVLLAVLLLDLDSGLELPPIRPDRLETAKSDETSLVVSLQVIASCLTYLSITHVLPSIRNRHHQDRGQPVFETELA